MSIVTLPSGLGLIVPPPPDTGFIFENKQVPKFNEAVKLCEALHGGIPQLAIIGWDIAIDANERVKILEWNTGHCDIKFSEAMTGPCFRGLCWERFARS